MQLCQLENQCRFQYVLHSGSDMENFMDELPVCHLLFLTVIQVYEMQKCKHSSGCFQSKKKQNKRELSHRHYFLVCKPASNVDAQLVWRWLNQFFVQNLWYLVFFVFLLTVQKLRRDLLLLFLHLRKFLIHLQHYQLSGLT